VRPVVQVHPRAPVMKDKIFTWRGLVEYLGVLSPNKKQIKDLSSLVTICRIGGIGIPISYQKTKYSKKDISVIKKMLKWWSFLAQESNEEFRDQYTTKVLANALIQSINKKKSLITYSVFCPSYKKGVGVVGYTGVLGSYTQKIINKFVDFVYKSNQVGVETKGLVYFSDLLLENYNSIKKTNYKNDLQSNYAQFQQMFSRLDFRKLITVKLLSEVPYFKKYIGEKGIEKGAIDVPAEIINLVKERNSFFYKDNLGWNEKQVEDRTIILARCYSLIGDYFRKNIPGGIMYWVESAYERGRMYHGAKQEIPIPIVYPKKDEN